MRNRRMWPIVASLGVVGAIVAGVWWWTRTSPKGLLTLARAALAEGRMAECEELALRAAERDAGLAAAWILAAKAAERQGRLGQAIEYLREVDMNRAEGVRAQVDEADVLIRLGRLLEAGNALDSAAHASPDDVALQKRAVHLLMGLADAGLRCRT